MYVFGSLEILLATCQLPLYVVAMKGKAVIIMGSERDLEFCREIAKPLKTLTVDYEFRVTSAHKTPQKVLEVLSEFEAQKVV
jgi:phosphoribosylcarboxyaminoimidazole (NCAIR) mutase